MKLSFKLTFKFIIKAPLQSLIIIFTMLAGIASLLFLTTLFTSLNRTLENAIYSTLYDLRMVKQGGGSFNYNEDDYRWILENDYIDEVIYLTNNATTLITTDEEQPFNITYGNEGVFKYFKADEVFKGRVPNKGGEIIISESLRKQLALEIPSTITIKRANRLFELEVVGSYQRKDDFFNSRNAYTLYSSFYKNLESAPFGAINIRLKDKNDLDDYLEIHNEHFKDSDYRTVSLVEESTTYKLIKKTQVLVLATIQIFIALAIFLITASVISFSINEKRMQIGVLKALGYEKRHLRRTFILQSYLLAVIASVLGYLLTDIGLRFLRKIMRDPEGKPRLIISVNEYLYIISFVVVFLTVMLATLNSLRKAHLDSTVTLLKE